MYCNKKLSRISFQGWGSHRKVEDEKKKKTKQNKKNSLEKTNVYFLSSVQLLSCVQLFATPWIAACQASLSITNPRSLLTHVHWVSDAIQPSHPLSSPSPPAFNLSQHQGFYKSQLIRWPNFGVSGSASVLPVNIQDWFSLGWTGWISLQSKGLSSLLQHSSKASILCTQLSL